MRSIRSLLLLVLVAYSLQKIGVKQWNDGSYTDSDLVEIRMMQLFDFSAVQNDVTYSVTPETIKIFNKDTEIANVPHDQQYTSLTMGKFLTNFTVGYIFDEEYLVIQYFTRDGLEVDDSRTFTVKLSPILSKNTICTDMVFNHNLEMPMVYASCFLNDNSNPPKTTHYIVTVDLLQKKVGNVVTVPSGTGISITNEARLVYSQYQDSQPYLILYNQGPSHSTKGTVIGNQVMILTISQNGIPENFNKITTLTTSVDGDEFTYVQDLFAYHRTVVVVGRRAKTSTVLSYTAFLPFNQETISCIPAPVTTGLTLGYATIFNTGQLLTVDTSSSTNNIVSVYDLTGEFGTSTWIASEPDYALGNIEIQADLDHQWISHYQGNRDHGVLHFYDNSLKARSGFIVIDFVEETYNEHTTETAGTAACFIDDILVHNDQLGYRLYRWIKGDWLFMNMATVEKQFNHSVTINVTAYEGDDKTGVSNTATFYIVNSQYTKIIFNKTENLYLDAYANSQIILPIDGSNIISGNGVQYTLTTDHPEVKTQTHLTDISILHFDRKNRTDAKITQTVFNNHFAATVDLNNIMTIYICEPSVDPLSADVYCSATLVQQQLVDGEQLQDYAWFNNGYGWVWTQNGKAGTSTVYTFSYYNPDQIVANNLPYTAEDVISAFAKDTRLMFATVNANKGAFAVDVFALSLMVPGSKWVPFTSWNADNVGYDYFCPAKLQVNPKLADELDVLSACHGVDNRIIKLPFTGSWTSNKTLSNGSPIRHQIEVSSIVLNSSQTIIEFCNTGDEMIIYATSGTDTHSIYGVDAMYESSSIYNVPNDEFGMEVVFSFTCHSRLNMFTVTGKEKSSDPKYYLAVFFGNNRDNADRRVHSYLELDSAGNGAITSFEKDLTIIHTFKDSDGDLFFYKTYALGPFFSLSLPDLQSAGSLNVSISGKGFMSSSDSWNLTVALKESNFNVSVDVNGTPENKNGTISLEEKATFSGPIFTASLQNAPQGVSLIQRVQPQANLTLNKSDTKAQVQYNEMRYADNLIVALHTEPRMNQFVFIDPSNMKEVDRFSPSYDFVMGYDVIQVPGIGYLVVYNDVHPNGDKSFNALMHTGVEDADYKFNHSRIDHIHDKIRLFPTKNPNEFIMFAHSFTESFVAQFKLIIEPSTKSIGLNIMNKLSSNVQDFTASYNSGSNTVALFIVKHENPSVYHIAIDISSPSLGSSEEKTIDISKIKGSDFPNYDTEFISAAPAGDATNDIHHVAVSTAGTAIYALKIDLKQPLLPVNGTISNKFPTFDGFDLQATKDYFAMHCFRSAGAFDSAIIVWKFGSADTFYAMDFFPSLNITSSTSETKINNYKKNLRRPKGSKNLKISSPPMFSSYKLYSNGNSTGLLSATGDNISPLQQHSVGEFALKFTEANVAIGATKLAFKYSTSSPLNVADIVFGPGNDLRAVNIYFMFSVLGALVLISIAWMTFLMAKGSHAEEEDKYNSMGDALGTKITDNTHRTGLSGNLDTQLDKLEE